MTTINGSTEQIPGLFFDKGAMVVNVGHPEFGTNGGSPAKTAALNTAAIDEAKAYATSRGNKVLYFGPGTWTVEAGTDLTGYIPVGDGAVFSGIGTAIAQLGSELRRAGGSVVVDASGNVTITPLSLGSLTVSAVESFFIGRASVTGTTNGGFAVAGDHYSHCLVSVGFQNTNNPLNEPHQVAFYGALSANQYARGVGSFLAAFESALSVNAAAGALKSAVSYSCGDIGLTGAGTVEHTIGLMTNEETTGTSGNASIMPFTVVNEAGATVDYTNFTGEWYIYYSGLRPSYLGGSLTVGSEIFRAVRDSYLRIASGSSGGDGPTLLLFGPTHATFANKMQITASGGITITGAVTMSSTLDVTGAISCGGLTLTAGTDLILPGANFGITNGATRVIAFASGGNPVIAFGNGSGAVTFGTGLVTLGGSLVLGGGLTVGASNDITLPGGGYGIQNAQVRFLAVATGTNPDLTWVGKHITAASTTTKAGLNLPHGAAPTSPVDGDTWTTTAGVFYRINGVTKTVTLT